MVYMLVLLLMLDGSYKEELKKVLDFFLFYFFFFPPSYSLISETHFETHFKPKHCKGKLPLV